MTPVQTEIASLEERLRLAELGPDPKFFDDALADDTVLVSDGQATFAKSKVLEAHRAGQGPKFTRVEMTDMNIVDHGTAALVTCQRKARLVSERRDGRLVYYRVQPDGLRPLVDWIARYQAFWLERLDRLQALLKEMDE